jgi:hypothetical protein
VQLGNLCNCNASRASSIAATLVIQSIFEDLRNFGFWCAQCDEALLALAIFTDIFETTVFPECSLSINHTYLFDFRVRGVFASVKMPQVALSRPNLPRHSSTLAIRPRISLMQHPQSPQRNSDPPASSSYPIPSRPNPLAPSNSVCCRYEDSHDHLSC